MVSPYFPFFVETPLFFFPPGDSGQVANGKVELSVKQVRLINLGLRAAISVFAIFNDPQAVAGPELLGEAEAWE